MKLDIQVEGLRELQKKLLQLPPKVQGQPTRHALHAGAKPIKDSARQRHQWHDDTGFLRENIVQFSARKSEHEFTEQVRIGVKRRRVKRPSKRYAAAHARRQARQSKKIASGYYWRYLEFGTSRMGAKPFLRPAFESEKTEALRRITGQMRAEIDKAAGG